MAVPRQTTKPRRQQAREPVTGDEGEQRRVQARERKRQERRRAREGLGLFRIALDRDALEDALVASGEIDPSVADDQQALERALAEVLKRRYKIGI